jgi:O-acetyl-ADP-ribose deacetylase (regulator of RNase III)
LELKDNVLIQGGTVVQMLPPEGCGRRFIAQPPRRRRVTSSKFLPKVTVSAYGVLGDLHTKNGQNINKAPKPTEDMAIVDPAGLPFIKSGPGGAGGASGGIYRWLGLDREPHFPEPVREKVTAATHAKFYLHPGKCVVIHTVGPNFTQSDESRLEQDEATGRLATTYMNMLKEFADSGVSKLRMLPVSSSIFAGKWDDLMPEMTAEALERGFADLEKEDQDKVTSAESLEMCIFNEKEVEVYEQIFTTGARKDAKSSGGRDNAWDGGGRRGGGRSDRGGGRGRRH